MPVGAQDMTFLFTSISVDKDVNGPLNIQFIYVSIFGKIINLRCTNTHHFVLTNITHHHKSIIRNKKTVTIKQRKRRKNKKKMRQKEQKERVIVPKKEGEKFQENNK